MHEGNLHVVLEVLKTLGYEVVTGSDVTNFDLLYTRYLMFFPPASNLPTARRWTPSIMVKNCHWNLPPD